MTARPAEAALQPRRAVVPAVALAAALGVALGSVAARPGTHQTVMVLIGVVVAAGTWLGVRRVLQWRRYGVVLVAERERTANLFQASLEAHASMGVEEVEGAVSRWASLLLASEARVDRTPPKEGELGSRLRSAIDPDRWLIVAARRSGEAFDAEDERTLEVLVASTAAAVDNALLHRQTQRERQQLADLVGYSSDGIFSVDPALRVTSWNPAMGRITGRSEADAIGRPAAEVFPADEADGRAAPLDTLLTGGATEITLAVPTVGEEVRWLDCKVSPMPDGGCVVVVRDVSAKRQVDELKADFLATVSHELRTPLTPIQGFLQTLLRDDASFGDAERRRFYELMLRQSERLERLIRDLLDATSLQDRDHLFFPEEVVWDATASRVVDLFRRQDPNRSFELDIEANLPHVVADEQRGEQVLSNLLNNAVKYSPKGESVRVTVRRNGSEVVTTVADRGPGIAPAERDLVFERFTRLGNHLTRSVGGAGLGLYIARRLVESMGGTISVNGAPGGGAAFSFTLPVSPAPLAAR